MSKSKGTLLERELQATVRSGIFRNETEAKEEVLGTFFANKPQYRLQAALEMFASGEITLSRAAEIAGLNACRFRELWRQRGGRQEIEVDAAEVKAQANRIGRLRS